MPEPKDGCAKPARGPISESVEPASSSGVATFQEIKKMIAKVGKPAPDFEANAFVGEGFKPIKLSEYKGKWVVLCFYPGDFTFV
jgi:AhpC/TSA family